MQNSHSERAHALLSASGSERWLNCTPSARLEDQFGIRTTSKFAEEGTVAHEYAELCMLRDVLDNITEVSFNVRLEEIMNKELFNDEMLDEIPKYVDYCSEQFEAAKAITPDAIIEIERNIDLSEYIPEGKGLCDCNIIADNVLEVIDLKYGKGVQVSAVKNKQLMLYGLGALRYYEMHYDIKIVRLTIVQPRLNSISSWDISVEELLQWANTELKEKARMAFDGLGDITPGPWCKFCSIKNKCKKLANENLKIEKFGQQRPELLNDEEIAEIISRAPLLVEWANSIHEYALEQALTNNKVWPGFKLVEGISRRKWFDEEKAGDMILKRMPAYDENDIFKSKLKSITDIEKLIGKKKFNESFSDLVIKPQGKPTLVSESDKRPSLSSQAKNDFND